MRKINRERNPMARSSLTISMMIRGPNIAYYLRSCKGHAGLERQRMTNSAVPSAPATPWSLAVKLLVRWLENNERVDTLLESLPRMVAVDRGRCQSLLFGAVRHKGRIEALLTPLIARPPRARLQAILLVAGFELIEGGDEHHVARVVHHAVEQAKTLASQPEARLVNAVVRKLAVQLASD